MKSTPPTNENGRYELLAHPAQQSFLEAKRRRLSDGTRAFDRFLLISGRRGGKTRIGAVAAVEEMAVPNTLGWACAPSYPELLDYVIPAIFAVIPKSWIKDWSASRYLLTLTNGAQCAFRSLDDPERGRGPGLHWLWIDEARKVGEVAWDTIAPALTDKPGAAWLTTSPNGFDWVYKRFWLPALTGDPGYWAIKYRTLDNPAIRPEEIARAKAQTDPLFFQQEYEGDFVSFTGAVFGPLLEPQILKDDARIRQILPEYPALDRTRPCLVGLDPGADHPFAGVVLVSTELGLVVVGEHCQRNLPAYDHALALKAMLRGLQPSHWAIDRSAKQMAIELAQHGIQCSAANNDVVAGIQRIQSWLRTHRLWFIEPWCPKLVEQMRSYQWDDTTAADGSTRREQVKKINDDLPDCLVAGTPILTRRDAAVPIEHVAVGDEVWTRAGWKPVIDAFRLTAADQTYRLTTDHGLTVQGTGTHRIWVVGKGWTPLRSVRNGDILLTCTPTTTADGPDSSGRDSTDQSLTASTSTTETGTPPTTTDPTWSASEERTTSPRMDGPDHPCPSSAPAVDARPPEAPPSPGSAPTPASPHGDDPSASTRPSEPARPATEPSPQAASLTSAIAPDDAATQAPISVHSPHAPAPCADRPSSPTPPPFVRHVVTKLDSADVQPVYNLTVADVHEYVAGGILVANSLRYGLMLYPHLPTDYGDQLLSPDDKLRRELRDVPLALRWAVERQRRMAYAEAGIELEDDLPVDEDAPITEAMGDFYA